MKYFGLMWKVYTSTFVACFSAIGSFLGTACFLDPTISCGQELRCPLGWTCAAHADVCIPTGGCGDEKVSSIEECDDGNRTDGDGCDINCTITKCGNGIITSDEFCDDGNITDGDGCDHNCKPTGCHNGVVTEGEACDDGNTDDNDTCVGSCMLATCGDKLIETVGDVENCDDGNMDIESCVYGESVCEVCGPLCRLVPGISLKCNDGIRQAEYEQCDDGNATCGSCSSDCKQDQSVVATGLISVLGANILQPHVREGEALILDDGINPPVKFEFALMPNTNTDGIVRILLSSAENASGVRGKVVTAINQVEDYPYGGHVLFITASPIGDDGALLSLIHDRATSLGNKNIIETVVDSNFVINGMFGGKGGDCEIGATCRRDADCALNDCHMNKCR